MRPPQSGLVQVGLREVIVDCSGIMAYGSGGRRTNTLSSSKTLLELLHNCFPECLETHQNHFQPSILHNNIPKVGSFRNRQVNGSSPFVGSSFSTIEGSCQSRIRTNPK